MASVCSLSLEKSSKIQNRELAMQLSKQGIGDGLVEAASVFTRIRLNKIKKKSNNVNPWSRVAGGDRGVGVLHGAAWGSRPSTHQRVLGYQSQWRNDVM